MALRINKYNFNIIIIMGLVLFIITLCVQNTFALTASSTNYSVGMFGMGMATGSFSFSSYNVTFLSEVKGTTRGAGSDLYTANIGFFDNTIYYRTVSITFYLIYPASAVVGSTIGLYILALNSQSVWAKIMSPNSQEQILSLINDGTVNYVPSPSVVGTYEVVFYANSSVGVIDSVVDSFEFTAQEEQEEQQQSGGGGTTTIIEKCVYNWDCTPWSVCSEGNQTRACKNIGTCEGEENRPIEEMLCSEALFDIALELENLELVGDDVLRFGVGLVEKIGVEKIDVHIKYSIIDETFYEIFSQIETKAIQENLSYEKEISGVKLEDGEYILRVEIFYGYQQRAFAEQRFEIRGGELRFVSKGKWVISKLLIIFGVLIVVITLIVFVLVMLIRKKKRRKRNVVRRGGAGRLLKSIGIENNLVIVFGFVVIGLLFVFGKNMTGFVVGSTIERSSWNLFGFVLGVGMLGLLIFLCRNKIKVSIENVAGKIKSKYSKNSISGLVKKKVYTERGDYLGEVEGVVLGKNRIDSLKIKLNKVAKKKIKNKGIIVKYGGVKSVGHIVIINGDVFGKLGKV